MKRVFTTIIAFTLLLSVVHTPVNAVEIKEWTLAVYINADNNLDPFGEDDQEQMAKVGSSDFLNIVTLLDREGKSTKLNYIEKNKIVTIKDLGEIDTGNYYSLVNFIKFVKQNYPAKKYAIVIWNHGTGWKKYGSAGVYKGISYDDSSGNHITNNQLQKAMGMAEEVLGQKIDVFVMDACLMQMVEVGHAVKDHTRYIVASQELEPGSGAPYHDILAKVTAKMTAREFANTWVDEFAKSYDGGSQGFDESTQSSIDSTKFGPMTDSINGLAKAIMSGRYVREVQQALRKVQKFDFRENIDLIHFAELMLEQLENNEAIKTACEKVIEATQAAVAANAVTGNSTKNAKGIAIYLPTNFRVEDKYFTISFAKETMWAQMIVQLHRQATVAAVVNDVVNENLHSMKTLLRSIKTGNKDKTFIRFIVRELNFELYTQKKIPACIQREFDSLFNELKAMISS